MVVLQWSKTIQFGERQLTIPLLRITNSLLCPVSAYERMCSLVSAPVSAPAFCLKREGQFKPIIYSQLQEKLKHLIAAVGLNPDSYSSHSFRRGGASWAFKAKVQPYLIQLHGDWRSDAYKRYLDCDIQDRASVFDAMRALIQS